MIHTDTSFGDAKCHRRSRSFGGKCPMILFCVVQISNAGILSQLGRIFFVEWRTRVLIMLWPSALSPFSFRERLKRLTRIKLPKLWPRSWTRDLLEDSFCKEERGIILCGMWSLWNSRNERKDGKMTIDPGSVIEWALEACFQLATAP